MGKSPTGLRQEEALQPVRWVDGALEILDQRLLPQEHRRHRYVRVEEVADCIRRMKVRGAPAIGVCAAYGMALPAFHPSKQPLDAEMTSAFDTLLATRPTAVNLPWALERMKRTYFEVAGAPLESVRLRLLNEARAIHTESHQADREIARLGAEELAGRDRILTHCNAGPLATAGYGTAIGVIREAYSANPNLSVLVDETRPFLQGARLTAWELLTLQIPATLITDSMAGFMMQRGEVDAVVVGADRVVANGDVANKIGTYSLAVLARAHGIPFYVAAPTSTLDGSLRHGSEIPIEERDPREVLEFQGARVAPEGMPARHPAFDVTPSSLVTAIITEAGVVREPYDEGLRRLGRERAAVG